MRPLRSLMSPITSPFRPLAKPLETLLIKEASGLLNTHNADHDKAGESRKVYTVMMLQLN